jgi:hypothetical protein
MLREVDAIDAQVALFLVLIIALELVGIAHELNALSKL